MVAALQRTDPPMLVSRNGSEGPGLYVAMDPRHAKASTLCTAGTCPSWDALLCCAKQWHESRACVVILERRCHCH